MLLTIPYSSTVVAGVNKAVQTTASFITSALFFCSTHDAQCFTVAKGVSLGLVVIGVLLYAIKSDAPTQDGGEQGEDYYLMGAQRGIETRKRSFTPQMAL